MIHKAILQAGLALWPNVTARGVGNMLGMTHSGVLYHCGSAAKLKDAVAAYAVQTLDPVVVPQLIVARHPAAASLPADVRAALLSGV